MQLTKKEILNETVDYYKNHPRSITGPGAGEPDMTMLSTCMYYSTVDGQETHCAVGRCFNDSVKNTDLRDLANEMTVDDLLEELDLPTVDDLFEDKYKGHKIGFWRNMQTFHDSSHNWKPGKIGTHCELTETGQREVEYILNETPESL